MFKGFLTICFVLPQVIALGTPTFPDDWVGRWEGEVALDKKRVGMRLVIEPIVADRFRWTIKYDGEAERLYELIAIDATSGHFKIDEKNGIVIDHFYNQGVLTASFIVNGKLIFFRYELTADGIRVEAPAYLIANPQKSGASQFEVHSFLLDSFQVGMLRRKFIETSGTNKDHCQNDNRRHP